MTWGTVFVIVLTALECCATAAYAWDGDWRRALYWGAAAVISVAVTV